MNNYAMIPINRRYDENDNRLVRRILIRYESSDHGYYRNCKVIDKDDYFKNPNSSHQYNFTNEGFELVSDAYGYDKSEFTPYQFDAGRLYETAEEFKAKTNKEAIEIFQTRSELH